MAALLPRASPSAVRGSSARARAEPACALSLVVPAFDEEPNLEPLFRRILDVFGAREGWELVLVDDGSSDGTARVIRELVRRDRRVIGVSLARNCGQTAALAAGIELARGELIGRASCRERVYACV